MPALKTKAPPKAKAKAKPAKTLWDLFVDQLKDAVSAETQLIAALPKMARAASDPALKAGFAAHLAETKNQLKRLRSALKTIDADSGANACEATKGLIAEAEEILEMGLEPAARDAGLIGAAQKVEHYEIALYGTLCAYARRLGLEDVAGLLHETLEEEKAANDKLNDLAKSSVSPKAAEQHR